MAFIYRRIVLEKRAMLNGLIVAFQKMSTHIFYLYLLDGASQPLAYTDSFRFISMQILRRTGDRMSGRASLGIFPMIVNKEPIRRYPGRQIPYGISKIGMELFPSGFFQ